MNHNTEFNFYSEKLINEICNFIKENNRTNLFFWGSIGIGKTYIIEKILLNLHYEILHYDILTSTYRKCNKNSKKVAFSIDNLMNDKKVIIIDNAESVTITNEKNKITKLISENSIDKKCMYILISNAKEIHMEEVLTKCKMFEFPNPDMGLIKQYIEQYFKTEEIKYNDTTTPSIITLIINYIDFDLRKLFFIISEIKIYYMGRINLDPCYIFESVDFYNILSSYVKIYKEVDIEHSYKLVLMNYDNKMLVDYYYNYDKVILPLYIQENYIRDVFNRKMLKKDKVMVMNKISDQYSFGDLIETNIYCEQNWNLQDMHCFLTTSYPLYILNANAQRYHSQNDIKYNTNFSSELNKTSLKNINRKNISNMTSIKYYKFTDLLEMRNLFIHLNSKNKTESITDAFNNISKDVNTKNKFLEILSKIDKTKKISSNNKIKKKYYYNS